MLYDKVHPSEFPHSWVVDETLGKHFETVWRPPHTRNPKTRRGEKSRGVNTTVRIESSRAEGICTQQTTGPDRHLVLNTFGGTGNKVLHKR